MRTITLTCPECGTLVAGNVLEERRRLKCPRVTCDAVLEFDDLPEADREYILSNPSKFNMD